ncbi:hypothetical protein SAMN05421863_100180 [Nitrosomonas communis]|uniref:Uncharacterized protein n=2 Tax=Nitrosomonas communis TaxID=44574 RepID=A0A1I4IVI3_9PROT|nr:hypothetical protein SAMN05421863_100180 [Nitrosomonas communis]
MRFIIENEDVFHAHEFRHDALDHLAFVFSGLEIAASAALQQGAVAFGKCHTLTQLESMIVGDDDLGRLISSRKS